MKKTIILISGKKGTGKTTLANDIIKTFDAERMSFADPIKQQAKEFVQSLGFVWEVQKELYRPIIQATGTALRNLDENYWINKAIDRVEDSDKKIIVFDDCRFIGEMKAFDDFKTSGDYTVIKVKSKRKSIYASGDTDISEVNLDNISDASWDLVFTDADITKDIVQRIAKIIDERK